MLSFPMLFAERETAAYFEKIVWLVLSFRARIREDRKAGCGPATIDGSKGGMNSRTPPPAAVATGSSCAGPPGLAFHLAQSITAPWNPRRTRENGTGLHSLEIADFLWGAGCAADDKRDGEIG